MMTNRRWAATAVMGILAIGLASPLWSAAPVLAHARLKSSTPAKGAIVPVAPSAVEIIFTNDIQKIAGSYDIAINKDRGPSVTGGPAVLDDADRSKLSVPLKPDLAPGRYVVNWKNVSDEDGDPAEGAFSFYVGDYTPNTVDLTNDAQLERVGAESEETPAAGDTPTSSEDTPPSAATSASTPAAVVTTTNGAESDGGDGGNNNVIWIIAAAVGAGVIAAIAGFAVMRGRS
ncbi:MAG: copper resistance protein CopC [Chloroflexi bacterium]|nr:copper resistance protein CopC [Chloroflexota bacterium]